MSVLIKGLKMPKDCAIKVAIRGDDGIASVYLDDGKADYYSVIELPDHGDLIDKNIIVDSLSHGSKNISEIQKGVKDERTISYCQGIMVGYENSIMALNGAPVIIPAERNEE